MSAFSEYAHRYSELGWALVRLNGKVPVGREWQTTKPGEPENVAGRWSTWGERYNLGAVLGSSGLAVLEYDDENALETFRQLVGDSNPPLCRTGSGKLHAYYAAVNGVSKATRDGLELRVGSHQCVVPPSLHPETGEAYAWERAPWDVPLPPLPQRIVDYFAGAKEKLEERLEYDPDAKVGVGQRREQVFKLACSLVARGVPPDAILTAARAFNVARCDPPLSDAQVVAQVDGAVGRYEPATALSQAYKTVERPETVQVEPLALEEVRAAFERWLHLPDPGPLYAALGAVAANRLEGDPVWLLLVGPPGSGKSELVSSLSSVPNVHPASTLTEAALLSGSPKRERAKDAKGGLLRMIGDYGIIAAKDFGSVLSMNRDARAAVLAALREVYDGSWTRHIGTDGGRTLSWSGKVGLVAGCTPTIDRHHAVMGAMGERFVLYRLPGVESGAQASRALLHAGREKAMRAELSAAVAGLFAGDLREPRTRSEDETARLIALASLTIVCRSAVERDGYSREIELIPAAEAPTRLVIVLARLLDGLDAIGVERDAAWSVVRKAALDSIPATRLSVLDALIVAGSLTETSAVAEELGYPTSTTRRVLEDLTAHGVALRVKSGDGEKNVDRWKLTDWADESYRACVPEMSEGAQSLYHSRSAYSTTNRERKTGVVSDDEEIPF